MQYIKQTVMYITYAYRSSRKCDIKATFHKDIGKSIIPQFIDLNRPQCRNKALCTILNCRHAIWDNVQISRATATRSTYKNNIGI